MKVGTMSKDILSDSSLFQSDASIVSAVAQALASLVDQIKESHPIDDEGYPLEQYAAYQDAVALLARLQTAAEPSAGLVAA